MYVPLTLFVALKFGSETARINKWMAAFTGLTLMVLSLTGPAPAFRFSEYRQNFRVAEAVTELRGKLEKPMHVYADFYQSVGQLAYYGKTDVYFPLETFRTPGRWCEDQFRLWPRPRIRKGEHVLFLTAYDARQEEKLRQHFAAVERVPLSLSLLEKHLESKVFLLCREAKEEFHF
jgi:hypothetical protein